MFVNRIRIGTALAALAASCLVAPSPALAQDADPAAAEDAPAAWEYPKEVRAGGLRVALHEPSVLQYDEADGAISLRFPVAVTNAGGQVSYGALHVAGKAHLDLGSRLVLVDGIATGECPIPGLDTAIAEQVVGDLPQALPPELLIRLELLTARPGAAPDPDAEGGPKISTRPPTIHVRRRPTALVQIDGEPELLKVNTFPLQYVANSATDIFFDPGAKRWFLLMHEHWASADKIEGPWSWHDGSLPIVLTQLPVSSPRGHVWSYVPGTRRYAKRTADGEPQRPEEMPELIVSSEPAELVLLEGDPLFTLVPGVKLMTVANTLSDLFFHPRSGKYYLLLSGRWFVADDVDGPWEGAFGSLPDEFAKIPLDHPRGHVRWCVPGTPEAAEAAARSQLPERAGLSKRVSATVKYAEKEIRTSPLDGTEVRVVTNTEDDVLVVAGVYYACVRGAWFRSSNGQSPWEMVEALPDDLLPVPESSGFWHVNVCRALGEADQVRRFEIRGPYVGVFLHKGAPVYGTGWPRRGLLRGPNWYPAARTFGENRWYDPLAGAFQPRSVLYAEDGKPTASLWSPYTASFGRVRWYANRYLQGGRRMFAYDDGEDRFDLAAPRPDVYGIWTTDVKTRDGLPVERFPLGDRTNESSPSGDVLVADAEGNVFRTADGKVESPKGDGTWTAASNASDEVKAQLAAQAWVHALPDAMSRWAEARRGELPVNPVISGK